MSKIKKLICYLIGHSFNGYVPLNKQAMPEEYYCKRCNSIIKVDC